MGSIENAFRSARIEAVKHMSKMETINQNWGETTITDILIAEAASAVVVHKFNQHDEAHTGSDWIWWWVDDFYSYGMLVQAKRVTIGKKDEWKFDFGYQSGKEQVSQRDMLIKAANTLGLLPVYGLYLGTGHYRRWESCGVSHTGKNCQSCNQRSISLMPACVALEGKIVDAATTYCGSKPLETVTSSMPLSPTSLLEGRVPPELATLLQKMQSGVLTVVQNIASVVAERDMIVDRILDTLKELEREEIGEMKLIQRQDYRLNKIAPEYADHLSRIFGGHPSTIFANHRNNDLNQLLSPLSKKPPEYVRNLQKILHVPHFEDKLRDLVDYDFNVMAMPENIAGTVVIELPQQAPAAS
jgi:hypothetical protein maviaA2_03502